MLKEDITYLNFGSFGACARPVFEKYQQFQRELEEEPVQFFISKGPQYLKRSREALGRYLGCPADDLVYVTNPSYAVNIVAKSLQLKPGDEILTTDLEYGACEKTWDFVCKRSGAKLVRRHIPLPVQSQQQIVSAIQGGITQNTRLIFISHVTSTTALRLPVEQICAAARDKKIPCFVDGAHGPGLLPLNLSRLGATMYTGACHKWMLTPKGSAFIYVERSFQAKLDPLVVSWGYQSAKPSHSQFLDHHEGQGTRDYSAFLTIPAAIEFMRKNNWEEAAAKSREMVQRNAERFSELLQCELLAPVNEDFITQMLSIPVRTPDPEGLQKLLFEKHKIEVPVMPHNNDVYLRYSINAFNRDEDLDNLYDALNTIQQEGVLLKQRQY